MKETLQSRSADGASVEQPAPQGIGMAVAYDWGLTVQILLTPIVTTFFNTPGGYTLPIGNPLLKNVLSFVIAWPVGIGIAFFGQSLRLGRNWARKIQIGVNVLLTLVGIASLISLFRGIRAGNYWPLVPSVLLLIVSPLIAWRLSRPATARWFATVTKDEARKRHGGSWVWFISLYAIVGGVLETIASMK